MASLQSSMDAYAAQGRNCSPRQHLFFRDVENYLTFIETRQPDARDDVLDDVINMEDVFRPCRMALSP
ncbi:hypothetical protein Ndes2437B_g04336 [Nannochloris sp. 'desiccata']